MPSLSLLQRSEIGFHPLPCSANYKFIYWLVKSPLSPLRAAINIGVLAIRSESSTRPLVHLWYISGTSPNDEIFTPSLLKDFLQRLFLVTILNIHFKSTINARTMKNIDKNIRIAQIIFITSWKCKTLDALEFDA